MNQKLAPQFSEFAGKDEKLRKKTISMTSYFHRLQRVKKMVIGFLRGLPGRRLVEDQVPKLRVVCVDWGWKQINLSLLLKQ